jgi:hypothetical protein
MPYSDGPLAKSYNRPAANAAPSPKLQAEAQTVLTRQPLSG